MSNDSPMIAGMPKWHQFMRPVLEVLSDENQWTRRNLLNAVMDKVGVPDELREIQYGKSGSFVGENRIGWAKSALNRAKLINTVTRGVFMITDAGREFLQSHPIAITEADLASIPAYVEYVPLRRNRPGDIDSPNGVTGGEALEESTPEERIQVGLDEIEDHLKSELLTRLRESEPFFFEQVVRGVLVNMGYGREGELKRLVGSGDSGIDGVIDRDELGLSRIYIQAKRYAETNVVGRPLIQEFIGALATRGAATGVFFTTSRFSKEAAEAAERTAHDVALVDGLRLTELMIKFRVGVQLSRTIELVKIDEDFFAD